MKKTKKVIKKTSSKKKIIHTVNALGIIPLGDKVLIKPDPEQGEVKTASGIILPGKNPEEKQERGTIVAIGKGRMDESGGRIPMEVKVGDKVYFTRGYDIQIFKIRGDEHMLIPEHNVLAVIQ